MVKLIFIDGEYEYDNSIIIFFETLKNHIEDFGYSTEIDLRGIKIKKDEFDSILSTCKIFVKNNRIYEMKCSERRKEIEDYLGLMLEYEEYNDNDAENYDDFEHLTEYNTLVNYCARKGYLGILEYVHKNGCYLGGDICKIPAKYGNLECLKYCHKNGYRLGDICTISAKHGNIECLKYAYKNGCRLNKHTCEFAIMYSGITSISRYEHLECLKYAHENGCAWNEGTCECAAMSGSLEFLKYLHENNCEWDKYTCNHASEEGQLECLKYAYENDCPIDIKKCLKHATGKCIEYLESLL